MKEPKCTFLLFSTGKFICTGNKAEDNVKKSIKKFSKILQSAGFITFLTQHKIVNVVGTCQISEKFSYYKLGQYKNITYEPEIFPACLNKD